MRGVFLLILILLLTVGGVHKVGLASDAPAKEGLDLLALPEFREMTEQFPPEVRFEIAAVVNIYLHHYAQAIPLLEVLVSEQPNRSELWMLLAFAYNRDDAPQDAYDAANIAMTLDPFYEFFSIERGIAAFQLGRHREAVEDLSRYLKTYTTSAKAHYYLGLAHARLGDLTAAQENLIKARALSPMMVLLTDYHLAQIDVERGRITEAIVVLTDTLEAFENVDVQFKHDVRHQLQRLQSRAKAEEGKVAIRFREALNKTDAQNAVKNTPQPTSPGS